MNDFDSTDFPTQTSNNQQAPNTNNTSTTINPTTVPNTNLAPQSSLENRSKTTKRNMNSGSILTTLGYLFFTFIVSFCSGVLAVIIVLNSPGLSSRLNFSKNLRSGTGSTQVVKEISNIKTVNEESAIIDVASKTTDSVVSIIVSRDLPALNNRFGGQFDGLFGRDFLDNQGQGQPTQIGAGSGYIVSTDGFIITNRHVVDDTRADYTVVLNSGEILPTKVLARDPIMDIAILKAEAKSELKPIILGDSGGLKIGQTAIAIGNSLGEFNNTFSRGIISGLGRTIVASDEDGGASELLENIIQTDASINPGNSGGPLVDINGNVIGMNVANSPNGENIGFAIPINEIKPVLKSVIETGQILRPYLGISFLPINPEIAKQNNLPVDYGALLNATSGSSAVAANGPAAKAGLRQGDIILSIDGQKIDTQNPLPRAVQSKKVGDEVVLKVRRGDAEIEVKLVLEAR